MTTRFLADILCWRSPPTVSGYAIAAVAMARWSTTNPFPAHPALKPEPLPRRTTPPRSSCATATAFWPGKPSFASTSTSKCQAPIRLPRPCPGPAGVAAGGTQDTIRGVPLAYGKEAMSNTRPPARRSTRRRRPARSMKRQALRTRRRPVAMTHRNKLSYRLVRQARAVAGPSHTLARWLTSSPERTLPSPRPRTATPPCPSRTFGRHRV